MIFSSIEYLVFFCIFLLLMIFLKSKSLKKAILLISSYYFYAYWDFRFVFLIIILSAFNYFVGLKIEYASNIINKKRWLTAGIVVDLIVLGFFKYYNFFIDSANHLLSVLHIQFPFLNILLPVGISFCTFEVISYIIDIYRGTNKSAKSIWDLGILVAFFPHLISGPILKPSHFLPQLNNEITIKWINMEKGIQIFLVGLAKKILIADQLAFFVDPVFKTPDAFSSLTVWFAVIAYAIQIFCDFSGYTDMAIGSAKCLGFEIPANFNMPYISRSITEFWRRWHISLSTWLKEYLYFSLGGNKKGKMRQYINLFLVMFLGGLWHGASWNFVFWGALHGTALAVHKIYSELTFNLKFKETVIYKFFSWLITLVFVCFAWVFFRAAHFADSAIIIKKMLFIGDISGINWYATSIIVLLPLVFVFHYIGNRIKDYIYLELHTFKGLFLLFFVLLGLFFLKPVASSPFIYFQF